MNWFRFGCVELNCEQKNEPDAALTEDKMSLFNRQYTEVYNYLLLKTLTEFPTKVYHVHSLCLNLSSESSLHIQWAPSLFYVTFGGGSAPGPLYLNQRR